MFIQKIFNIVNTKSKTRPERRVIRREEACLRRLVTKDRLLDNGDFPCVVREGFRQQGEGHHRKGNRDSGKKVRKTYESDDEFEDDHVDPLSDFWRADSRGFMVEGRGK